MIGQALRWLTAAFQRPGVPRQGSCLPNCDAVLRVRLLADRLGVAVCDPQGHLSTFKTLHKERRSSWEKGESCAVCLIRLPNAACTAVPPNRVQSLKRLSVLQNCHGPALGSIESRISSPTQFPSRNPTFTPAVPYCRVDSSNTNRPALDDLLNHRSASLADPHMSAIIIRIYQR